MVHIVVPDASGGLRELSYDTNTVEILDGCLVVRRAGVVLAGFAAGGWRWFEIRSNADG